MQGNAGYKIDICFCIDGSGSMGPFIDKVKQKALAFDAMLKDGMKADNKDVSEIRVKVIDFSDYAAEAGEAIHESEFFALPDNADAFRARLDGIVVDNKGGDTPENAIEAIAIAMKSDWVHLDYGANSKGRHIIVVLTDAPPLNLGERSGCLGYPTDLPADEGSLALAWRGFSNDFTTTMNENGRRLIVFGPAGTIEGHSWENFLGLVADQTVISVLKDRVLENLDMSIIVEEIVKSIGA